MKSKIYSRHRCDDTDDVAPKDKDSSNRSIEFNDAVIMLCIEMGQGVREEQKVFWVGSAPECSPSQRARMCCSV